VIGSGPGGSVAAATLAASADAVLSKNSADKWGELDACFHRNRSAKHGLAPPEQHDSSSCVERERIPEGRSGAVTASRLTDNKRRRFTVGDARHGRGVLAEVATSVTPDVALFLPVVSEDIARLSFARI
jgi:flavin-dependent dehydrogenase